MTSVARHRQRTPSAALATVTVLGLMAVTNPVTMDPSAATDPDLIDHPAHGSRALTLLGDQAGASARRNDLSTPELRTTLREDDTAWVDPSGQLFFKEPVPVAGSATARPAAATTAAATTTAATTTGAAAFPYARTFRLHSRPGSQRTIFLDFNGQVVAGTMWNLGLGVRTGAHPAYSLDAHSRTFSHLERRVIWSIFRRVAEDYAPFDVDVTTTDPGAAALARTGPADLRFGARALISPSRQAATAICGNTCGGAAYLRAFGAATYQPAWVFPHKLAWGTKAIAEAATHEVGHNLGLLHDGRGSAAYYGGHGIWAPIMGVGFSRPVVQWSRGEYAQASNPEDDFAVITRHGLSLRADEAGAYPATSVLPTRGTHYLATADDSDVYDLGVCHGVVTALARPAPTSPDLDIRLALLPSVGAALATSNPRAVSISTDRAGGLSARLATRVRGGVHFVRVSGVGSRTASTGYTDYGSVGAYTLTARCRGD